MEGKRLSGRYEILNRIGGGGMAVVYKAKDMSLHRNVAVKVLSESLSNDSEFIRRFSREAQAAASLSHPNIVNVYDVGEDDYTQFIVMELIEGPTLKQHIQEQGPLSVEEAAEIAIQICDGLSNAHDNGIVHRDIKPHNILLGASGRAKVTDFGIARAASSSTITQTGSVMGSVHYFSPEQARGGVITEKSDIYSLGVVFYEMLTGKLPFDGDSAIGIALQHLQEPVPDPKELNSDIPDNIVKILLRSMEKDPEMRYTSVRAMMQDIRYALQIGHRNEFTWGSTKESRTKDFYSTVPLTGDTNLSKKSSDTDSIPAKPNKFRSGNELQEEERKFDRPATSHTGKFGLTKSRIEGLRNIPVGEQTVLQKTVVWLDDVQQKLPWWKKAIFGLISVVLIFALALWLFNAAIGFLGRDNKGGASPASESSSQAQEKEQKTAADFKGKPIGDLKKWAKEQGLKVQDTYKENDQEKDTVIDVTEKGKTLVVTVSAGRKGETTTGSSANTVPDFVGLPATRAQANAAAAGLTLEYDNSHCWTDTTGGRAARGAIIETVPKAGDPIPDDKVIHAWQNVNKQCSKPPPSQGGSW
ncbi:Stk1 family PASTA domain-containing Ser/Thr kinase [Croceifilum oryzae]|nr:Stk1 family PASTA domain-containing Ser/Thr kinase [Croceifilum oryzae]